MLDEGVSVPAPGPPWSPLDDEAPQVRPSGDAAIPAHRIASAATHVCTHPGTSPAPNVASTSATFPDGVSDSAERSRILSPSALPFDGTGP